MEPAWFAEGMPVLAMFPLGSVLFPAMPLALRVFEERYLKMMGTILENEAPIFGVVLIERGSEVGGGDKRFDVGTIAEILQVEAPDGPLAVMARGSDRFRVVEWFEDDPFPWAQVEMLPNFPMTDDVSERLGSFELKVREILQELGDDQGGTWSADIELAEDPLLRLWQLVGISPLGTLDQQDLLVCDSATQLLESADRVLTEAWSVYQATRDTGRTDPSPESD